jgi:hypothetical protein
LAPFPATLELVYEDGDVHPIPLTFVSEPIDAGCFLVAIPPERGPPADANPPTPSSSCACWRSGTSKFVLLRFQDYRDEYPPATAPATLATSRR